MNKLVIIVVLVLFNPIVIITNPVLNETGKLDSIIVISNRQFHKSDSSYIFKNKVSPLEKLNFYLVKELGNNNLEITPRDSIFFISKLLTGTRNWVLFVHGDSKTFEEATLRGLQIQKTHNVNVIVFSWPSKEKGFNGSKNFKNSKRNLENSVLHFSSIVQTIKNLREFNNDFLVNHKISLFIHSLGNYYLETLVKRELMHQSQSVIFDNIILNAAAVNQKHHKEWLEKIQIQNQIYVISNRHDFNLKGVRIFTSSGKQLGEIVNTPFSENAHYINFSKSIGFRFPTGNTHTFFIGKMTDRSKNISQFYSDILQGKTPDLTDNEKFKKRKNNTGYNILK